MYLFQSFHCTQYWKPFIHNLNWNVHQPVLDSITTVLLVQFTEEPVKEKKMNIEIKKQYTFESH